MFYYKSYQDICEFYITKLLYKDALQGRYILENSYKIFWILITFKVDNLWL